jgi:flagellin-like protein
MRRERMDGSGVSEIVGALMLTLIVVVAAASFALFVSERQQEIQNQQMLELKRSQENLQVLSVSPTFNSTGGVWLELNFTVASVHNEKSRLTRMEVNGEVVKMFELQRYNRTSGAIDIIQMDYNDRFYIEPLETVNVVLNTTSDFFSPNVHILTADSVNLGLYTEYLNEFSKAFIPPTAVAKVITEVQWNGTAYAPFMILDASPSTFYGSAYATSWSWTILGDDDGDGNYGESGEVSADRTGMKTAANFPRTGISYQITLKTHDNYGMSGTTTFVFGL